MFLLLLLPYWFMLSVYLLVCSMTMMLCASWNLGFVGVRAREGPKPMSEFVLRVPNLDGDAKRIHGGLSWFGRKKALRPTGGSIVFPCT
jgi:hypothetical protein